MCFRHPATWSSLYLVGLFRCPVRNSITNINNSIATNLTTLVIVVLWVSSTISNTISIKITSILSSTTSSSLRIVSMRETLETKLESLKYG